MFGLPLELITMLFSTVLGGVMSMIGQNAKNKAEQQKILLGGVTEARNAGKTDKHFAWTRRLIALSAIFSIIVLPKMVAVWYPEGQRYRRLHRSAGRFVKLDVWPW